MSRFKHRKFDVTCDSNGTNCWVPVEQAKALLCDAMALESENAALAAEKEALVQQGIRDHGDWRSKLNFLEADYKAEVARLTAENERLRKAGDAMAEVCKENWEYSLTGSLDDYIENKPHKLPHTYHLCQSWLAAKKGRDAK